VFKPLFVMIDGHRHFQLRLVWWKKWSAGQILVSAAAVSESVF